MISDSQFHLFDAAVAYRGGVTGDSGLGRRPNISRIPKLAMKLSHDGPWIDERPFDAAGQDGYRDTLLWETLVAAANDQEPIVLVSGDNAASLAKQGAWSPNGTPRRARGSWAPSGGSSTHQTNRRASPRSCRWCRSSKWTLSTRWLSQRWQATLLKHSPKRSLRTKRARRGSRGFRSKLTSSSWIGWESPQDLDITAARELDDGTVALEMAADVAVSLQLYVWKYDAYSYEGDDFRISDYDYNESFVEGYLDRRVFVEFEAIFDP